jgi:hypothetical protein
LTLFLDIATKERHGAVCLLNTENGGQCISGSFVGVIRGYGKSFLLFDMPQPDPAHDGIGLCHAPQDEYRYDPEGRGGNG